MWQQNQIQGKQYKETQRDLILKTLNELQQVERKNRFHQLELILPLSQVICICLFRVGGHVP